MGLLIWLLTTNPADATSKTLANTEAVPIPDTGAWVSSPLSVSGIPAQATITSLDVSFACIHPNAGELVVELRADSDGTLARATLWNLEGQGVSDPSRTSTGVTTFNGLTAERTFYLYASDTVAGNSGSIHEWTLTIHCEVPSDIVVQGIPEITPNRVTSGQSITVSYTIRNDGPADAGATQTKIQIKDSTNVQLTRATFAEPAIVAGNTIDRSASVLIPEGSPDGTYTVYVILDNLSQLCQPKPSNDISEGVHLYLDSTRCDIMVEGSPQISPNAVTSGQTITVNYAVRNRGPADSGETLTMIEVKDSSGTVLTTSTFPVSAIPAGGLSNETAIVAIPAGSAPRTYAACILLDCLGQLSQTSEVNDLADPVLFVVAAAANDLNAPDLTAVGPPVVSPSATAPEDAITVEFSVANIGKEASRPVGISVELLNFWGGKVASQTVGIGAVPASYLWGPVAVDLHVPESTPGGVYSVRCVINGAGQRQSNYSNDFSPPQTVRISSPEPVTAGELVEGIDVSHHEGVIDWAAVRLAGKEFAYIKASEGGTAEGFETHPEYISENWPAAVAAGLAVGAYHFANPLRSPAWHNPSWSEAAAGARAEAAHFVETARDLLKPGFLPPGIDVEPHAVSYVWNPLIAKFEVDPAVGLLDPLEIMGADALGRWVLDWCVEVERLSGTRPVVYMNKRFATALAPYLGDRYNLWIAAVYDPAGQPDTSTWGTWQIHQYDWYGVISPGLTDYVDLNVMRGPLSDRLMKNATLLSRGRFTKNGSGVCIEVAGTDRQRVHVQGSVDLSTWFELGEIQMVNGCGEFLHPTGSTPQYFFRIRP